MFRIACALALFCSFAASAAEQHFLYVANPGTRNYVEYGGVGISVFDIDNGYKFVKRIPTWEVPAGKEPENVKGVAASAKTGIIYVSSLNRIIAINMMSGKRDKAYEGGVDRIALSPDGKIIYAPQLEGPKWHVVNAANGNVITEIETKSGSHNTIFAADGSLVYLAGLKSTSLSIADPKTNKVTATVGPFENVIRPFTVNGNNSLVFVNVNGLLGFEVGDVKTGKWLDRNAFVCPGRTVGATQFNCAVGVVPGRDANPLGRFGNSGVGIVVGPGTFTWNAGLAKKVALTEKLAMKLEGTFTNVTNRLNLGDPQLNITNNSFGKITSGRGVDFGGGRTGQVSVRLEF